MRRKLVICLLMHSRFAFRFFAGSYFIFILFILFNILYFARFMRPRPRGIINQNRAATAGRLWLTPTSRLCVFDTQLFYYYYLFIHQIRIKKRTKKINYKNVHSRFKNNNKPNKMRTSCASDT
jgi:hypothetical protein